MIPFWPGAWKLRHNLFWLSDEQWARIEPHLPTDVWGKERADDRRMISGVIHVLKSGCRWKDCPPEIRYRLLNRHAHSFGLTIGAEPHWGRVDDISGEAVDNYGCPCRKLRPTVVMM